MGLASWMRDRPSSSESMYENTQDFIAALERAGELKRIRSSVSPVLEITEIADRVSKSPAP
ncbi:MAG: hypothetical protein ACK58T_03965, partial [Phycisphaerae bacterium]